ncbi:MAG: hypothetical protein JNL58_22185 [Planctomyces sp.]|nr:hypothetical protein [Planctomyces sp.]
MWAVWAVLAAFGTYFCMYAFRKPFTAAAFLSAEGDGSSWKSALITSQILGYALSKFVGIKVISEMRPEKRAGTLLLLIGISELALILFAVTPPPWNLAFMFMNGVPLGMVFGLVLGFLEGRQLSEALSAGLCASFIVADGATKSVGSWLLQSGVSEQWMPAAAGGLFFVPLACCVAVLARTPGPSRRDQEARSERVQMTQRDRWVLIRHYGPGLSLLIIMYLATTILRSLRADFAPELWRDLGATVVAKTFTSSEILVAIGVLVINGSLIVVENNRRAFFIGLGTCLFGFLLIAGALLGLRAQQLSPFVFMVLVGFGLYFPYVAVHTTLFERLLAMTRERGNAGFLMYLADSTGYLGYVGCMLLQGTVSRDGAVLPFFSAACWTTCCVSVLCLILAARYFSQHGDVRRS